MTTYYKATRPDGTDFRSGTVDYAAALASGEVIRHPAKREWDEPSTYLSVSVEPADCTGFSWPCRLFRVEPVGRMLGTGKRKLQASPNKRACSALRVVDELPAHMAFGPNGEAVAAFIARVAAMTADEAKRLGAARGAARGASHAASHDAAWGAAQGAARGAAWGAAQGAARGAARGAAGATLVRDLITPERYDILVRPFVDAGLGELVA